MKRCYSCFDYYEDKYEVCPHCGQIEIKQPKEPIHLIPGTLLANRYVIGTAIGSGGFGIVYKAWDTKLETVVAVKEFYVSRLMTRAEGVKNVIVNRKSITEYQYRKKRFLAEARNMAKFGTHRSIPNVFEFFEENGTAYIVMELLQGVPLNEYLAEHSGKIELSFALYIANEVGNALISMHKQSIIHRDVAPDNIFICSQNEIKIKLMDLGAAKLADDTDEAIDIILKPGYSPVEQYDNSKNIGPWSDIYALGATLYVMLTGVKPDESTNRKIQDTVVPPAELDPSIPENISNAIMKAMAIDKHLRFSSVSDFLLAINGEKKVVSLDKEKKRRKFRRFSGIAISLVALIAASLFVGGAFGSKLSEETLAPASISVWFSVESGSSEEEAMQAVIADFTANYSNIEIEYRAIPAQEYSRILIAAARENKLPDLFESTNIINADVLNNSIGLDSVLRSPQARECLFLDQYRNHYSSTKKIPLAIEVPMAYVITSGYSSSNFDGDYFSKLIDFGTDSFLAIDSRCDELLRNNQLFYEASIDYSGFLTPGKNASPVLISSSMMINDVRKLNFEKKYVYYNNDEIICNYTYEWSVAHSSPENEKAAKKLLSWMLGNNYQRILMVNAGNDYQIPEIPINKSCFEDKISYLGNLSPIKQIYKKFKF